MSDIFREVDEDVRRDKATELWNQYQNYVYALVAIIVLATAGYRFYDYRRTAAAEAAGAAYQAALKLGLQGKTDEAIAAFAKVEAEGAAGYRTLARMAIAGETSKKDPKAGSEAFDAIANDASVDPLLRDATRLRAALARLDAGDVAAAKGALDALAAGNGAYRNSARLSLAAEALKEKDYASAGKTLDAIVADPVAPEAERQAATTLLGVVASNAPAK
jgi:hypothetical protein